MSSSEDNIRSLRESQRRSDLRAARARRVGLVLVGLGLLELVLALASYL